MTDEENARRLANLELDAIDIAYFVNPRTLTLLHSTEIAVPELPEVTS